VLRDGRLRPGIDGTAYDTAWLASVPGPGQSGRPRYPFALQWLADHQHPDGSWGGDLRYEHDRVICTLAALIPLALYGRRSSDRERVAAGTRYLWQHGHHLREEPIELVGFELLLPSLVRRARAAGLGLPPHLDAYRVGREEKLRLIPPDALYSSRTTVAHSLEFLGDDADPEALARVLGSNASIGNSPAATAYYLTKTADARVVSYLESCLAERGAAPVLHPCETFELLWSAYHLFLAGVPTRLLFSPQQRRALADELATGGVSLSATFPIPDADDTAVALLMLHAAEGGGSAASLRAFTAPDGTFASFPYERHGSVGVNAHVLHALLRVPGYPDGDSAIARLVDYLGESQIAGAYWIDKWHISPYYATTHVLAVLAECRPEQRASVEEAVGRARAWIRQTQNVDGSWGHYDRPTAEETAFAILALARGGDRKAGDRRRVARALAYLRENGREGTGWTPLWIDKCLYTPRLVVRAVIDSAWIAGARFLRERIA
jgi:halimadienyl-diphosphate synthase